MVKSPFDATDRQYKKEDNINLMKCINKTDYFVIDIIYHISALGCKKSFCDCLIVCFAWFTSYNKNKNINTSFSKFNDEFICEHSCVLK